MVSARPSRRRLEALMEEALATARGGRFRVEPNPTVGAIVLDRRGREVARGFHARWGGSHAEAAALASAGPLARGGTVIVTLEPCSHDDEGKKTPPCVGALIDAGVARVVAGTEDPNPSTRGRARKSLAAAGIAYEVGILEHACRASIARYEAHLTSDRPWVVAKWAQSLDGRIADHAGASRWISSDASRALARSWRGSCDAVVVGRGTVEADDPALTARTPGLRDPVRVVFDSELSVSPSAQLVATARKIPTLLVCADTASSRRGRALERRGVVVLCVERNRRGRVSIPAALRALQARGIRRVLLEGGGELVGAFAAARAIDHVAVFTAPVLFGEGPSGLTGPVWRVAEAPRLEDVRCEEVGGDALVEGYWPST